MEAVTRNGGPLILIADDDPTALLIMEQVLTSHNYRVIKCKDGAEAFDLFLKDRPSAVLLDGEMPVMSGYEACQRIREAEVDFVTPILMITGTDDSTSAKRAFNSGATDFLTKPINWSAFPYRLDHILRANDAHNEIAGLMRGIPDRILILDRDMRAIEIRHAGIFGHDGEGDDPMARTDARESLDSKFMQMVRRRAADVFEHGRIEEFETAVEDGDTYYETRVVPRDRSSVLVLIRDITARKLADKQIHQLAFYDTLTGLPNRGMFSREVNVQIERAKRTYSKLALLYLDLDRFKRINDTLGHSAGDELLSSVAKRLENCCRRYDRRTLGVESGSATEVRIARIGGDEFAVLLTGVDGPETAMTVSERILEELATPFTHEGHQFVVSPSIGISMMPDDGDTLEDLLKNADTAMYQAKKNGRNNFRFFTDTMNLRSLERLHLENELRVAIEERALTLAYQPKYCLRSSRVVGVEALLRWKHKEFGQISPARFVRVAEETGLIIPLGRWVFEEACRQIQEWQGTALDGVPVAVNVSSQQFLRDDFVDDFLKCLWASGIKGQSLEIEITESTLMTDTSRTILQLEQLKEAGVSLALDDFGTGYSSFDYLRKFPVDRMKIDRSFVREIGSTDNGGALCAAMIAMAQQLGLSVVAEGVEEVDQLSFLQKRGCDEIQGYYFCRPIPAGELLTFMTELKSAGGDVHLAPRASGGQREV